MAVRAVAFTATLALAPLRMGSGFPSGVEICARSLQLSLDRDYPSEERDACLFSLDIKNAFHTIRRGYILDSIREHCPELEPLFRLFYQGDTELRFSDGSAAGRSATEGDPLSMILLALGFWKPLCRLQQLHKASLITAGVGAKGHILTYADDVADSLPAPVINDFCMGAEQILAEYDLVLVRSKCGLHGRLAALIEAPVFPVSNRISRV